MNRFFCLFFLIILSSCSSKDTAPSDIIQPKEMEDIMWDVMRAQALALETSRKDSSLNDTAETKALTQKVFEIHKINAPDFNKSYDWYIKHPGAMRLIFDTLYKQKQKIEMELVPGKNLSDSFRLKELFDYKIIKRNKV